MKIKAEKLTQVSMAPLETINYKHYSIKTWKQSFNSPNKVRNRRKVKFGAGDKELGSS